MTSQLSTTRRLIVFALGWLLILAAWLCPTPAPIISNDKTIVLTESAKLCLGILAMVVLYWVTEIMPFAVTGFLGIVLLHAFGVQQFGKILEKGFGHPVVCFTIGVQFFSLAVTHTGLGNRLARLLLAQVGRSPRAVLFAFMAAGTFISAWMSDAAVAAILMPIAVGILRAEGLQPLKSNFGKALLISCVWGPSIGGIATPAGAAPNPISLRYLEEMAGIERSFVDWMVFGVPAALILLPIACLILIRLFPPEMDMLQRVHLAHSQQEKGKLSRGEWTTIIVFVVTVALWVLEPYFEPWFGLELDLPMEYVFFATVLVFFIPKLDVLTWTEVHRECSWSALLLMMTGISIGFVVGDSGIAEWISYYLLQRFGELPLYVMIVATALTVCLLHNLFASNTITAVVMVPIILHTAIVMGAPPWLAVAPAAFLSTMGLLLVTSAPTNMIPYTAGYFSIRDFAKAGIIMSVVGPVVIGSAIYVIHVVFGVT